MNTLRRRLMQAALIVLPAMTIAGVVLAADPAPGHAPLSMEMVHQVLADIPGPEYGEANRLKNEAMHTLLMGGDLTTAEPKLRAFATEYSRVSGGDPKGMQDHVMEMGAQLAELAKDPQFRQHLEALHAGH